MLKCVKGLQWTAVKHTEGNGRKHLKPVAHSTNAKGDFFFIINNIIHLYYRLLLIKGFHFWTSDLFSLYSSRFFGVFFVVNPPDCIHRMHSPAMWNLKQIKKETDA